MQLAYRQEQREKEAADMQALKQRMDDQLQVSEAGIVACLVSGDKWQVQRAHTPDL